MTNPITVVIRGEHDVADIAAIVRKLNPTFLVAHAVLPASLVELMGMAEFSHLKLIYNFVWGDAANPDTYFGVSEGSGAIFQARGYAAGRTIDPKTQQGTDLWKKGLWTEDTVGDYLDPAMMVDAFLTHNQVAGQMAAFKGAADHIKDRIYIADHRFTADIIDRMEFEAELAKELATNPEYGFKVCIWNGGHVPLPRLAEWKSQELLSALRTYKGIIGVMHDFANNPNPIPDSMLDELARLGYDDIPVVVARAYAPIDAFGSAAAYIQNVKAAVPAILAHKTKVPCWAIYLFGSPAHTGDDEIYDISTFAGQLADAIRPLQESGNPNPDPTPEPGDWSVIAPLVLNFDDGPLSQLQLTVAVKIDDVVYREQPSAPELLARIAELEATIEGVRVLTCVPLKS